MSEPIDASGASGEVIRELDECVELPSRKRMGEIADMIESAARAQRRLGRHRELLRDLRRGSVGANVAKRSAMALRRLWGLS